MSDANLKMLVPVISPGTVRLMGNLLFNCRDNILDPKAPDFESRCHDFGDAFEEIERFLESLIRTSTAIHSARNAAAKDLRQALLDRERKNWRCKTCGLTVWADHRNCELPF